jgi:RNA polymerase sigma factor (sigma-70 family)
MASITNTLRRTLLKLGNATPLSDGELLQRFVAQQDQAAFGEIVRRHGPMVLRVCRRVLQHTQDAEDAFQATFVVLARKAALAATKESVGGWLHCVACRTACYARKTRAAHRRDRSTALDSKSIFEVPASAEPAADLRLFLDQELQQLPEKYRSVMVLHYLEGKTVEEAARQLGCQASALRKRLQWARERLRRRLEHRGLAVPALALAVFLSQEASAMALPVSLVTPVIDAVKGLEAGQAAGTISPAVSGLAEAVLREMARGRMLRWAGVLAMVLLGAVGIALAVEAWSTPPSATRSQPTPDRLMLTERATIHPADVVMSVAFSPNGQMLATPGEAVQLWDVHTGKELAKLRGASAYSLAFAPNGKLLATGTNLGTVTLWSLETSTAVATLSRAQQARYLPPVCGLDFSPDGQFLAASCGNAIVIWDMVTHKEHTTISVRDDMRLVWWVGFSPDGQTLAAATNAGLVLWDWPTAKERSFPKASQVLCRKAALGAC